MSKFRVGMVAQFFRDDGTITYDGYDIGALERHPDIEIKALKNGPRILASDVADVDVLVSIPMSGDIGAESFEAGGRLAAIARMGVGYEDVDVAACTANRVALSIAADAVRRPTAVAALTLILAATTHLADKHRLSRLGPEGWRGLGAYRGMGLVGRTLGIVGLGNVGAEVVRLAMPLEMHVIAFDPYADPAAAAALGVRLVPLEELLAEADVVSLHCQLTDETRGLIDAERLRLMKPSAYLVNVARGGVVDQPALVAALRARRIAGAGLDVFADEPAAADDPLFTLDNVVFSGHALNGTDQCVAGFAQANVAAVLKVMAGRVPASVVNRELVEDAAWQAKLAAFRARFGAA